MQNDLYHAFDAWSGFWGNWSPKFAAVVLLLTFFAGMVLQQKRRKYGKVAIFATPLAAMTVVWEMAICEMHTGVTQLCRNLGASEVGSVIMAVVIFAVGLAVMLFVDLVALVLGSMAMTRLKKTQAFKKKAPPLASYSKGIVYMVDEDGEKIIEMPALIGRTANGKLAVALTRKSLRVLNK